MKKLRLIGKETQVIWYLLLQPIASPHGVFKPPHVPSADLAGALHALQADSLLTEPSGKPPPFLLWSPLIY